MSVTVRHLNADTSFLLIFSHKTHPEPSDLLSVNGAFSVIIDPWLTGSSIVSTPWFSITNRVVPSAIKHLSEIEEPDVVIISQNKPDHCHKETLLQLRSDGKTVFVTEPGAAKAIRGWNCFDPNRVHGLSKYNPKAKFGNSFRIRIPPLGPNGLPGEVSISFIPAKNYMTGLHNAFGITYQAPTKVKTLAPVSTIDLPKMKYFHLPSGPATLPPTSPPPPLTPNTVRPHSLDVKTREDSYMTQPIHSTMFRGHRPQLSRASETKSSEFLPFSEQPIVRPSQENLQRSDDKAMNGVLDFNFGSELTFEPYSALHTLPTPPLSPEGMTLSHSSSSSTSQDQSVSATTTLSLPNSPYLRYSHQPTVHPARPKAISILYTPHGVAVSDLNCYISNHLVRLPGALPLTLMFHSFMRQTNPWFLGGNIMKGAGGGIDIARSVMARCWISAHDEEKDEQGVAVKLLKAERMAANQVQKVLSAQDGYSKSGWICDVRTLDVGKQICLSSDIRDNLPGGKKSVSEEVDSSRLAVAVES